MALEEGSDLGQYKVVERAGQGGMATVYRAYQAALSRYVAIKVLPVGLAADSDFRDRFKEEAVRVAALRHPAIPPIYDFGETDGLTYIVSEYIDGGTLSGQLGSALPIDYTARILEPIAGALDYAHSRGVIHRDVKPSNILMARDGKPYLSDFGLARMMTSDRELTSAGMILGTPQYMAPEQGAGEPVPASDIYSLAVVAYHMLTGRVPFNAATPMAVILAHQRDPLPLPRTINPKIGPRLEAALLKGLARNPDHRPDSAAQFIRDLVEAAWIDQGTTVSSPVDREATVVVAEPTAASQPRDGGGSHVGRTISIALLVLLVLGGGAAGGLALLSAKKHAVATSPSPVPPAVLRSFTWQQWTPIKAVLDIDGPRKDGRMVVATNGVLQLIRTRDELAAFAPAYKVDAGNESYIAVSPGLSVSKAGCSFGKDDVFGLRLAAPLGITRVDGAGAPSNFVALAGYDALNAIGFDTGGAFDHRLLVAGPSHAHSGRSRVTAVDCKGVATLVTDDAPIFEGGVAVAPASFGKFGGALVVPDELSGHILAIRPDGSSELVADSTLPVGGDIGVESAGFVPLGFMGSSGHAYVADRVSPNNPHPGTDTMLRVDTTQLRAAGVLDGDLLIAAEGAGRTIDVHCPANGACAVRTAGEATSGAHIEGHLAFDFR